MHIPVTVPGAWHGHLPSRVQEVVELPKPGGGEEKEEEEENFVLIPHACRPDNVPKHVLFVSPYRN